MAIQEEDEPDLFDEEEMAEQEMQEEAVSKTYVRIWPWYDLFVYIIQKWIIGDKQITEMSVIYKHFVKCYLN